MNKIKVYSTVFPLFALLPIVSNYGLIPVIGSFIIPLLIIALAPFAIKKVSGTNKKVHKKVIVYLWIWGYLADLMGVVCILGIGLSANVLLNIVGAFEMVGIQIDYNCLFLQYMASIFDQVFLSSYEGILGLLLYTGEILFASVFTFVFDYNLVFKKYLPDVFTKKQMVILSLFIAILTPLFVFLFPLLLH